MPRIDNSDLKTISYHISSYFDLWDVVQTIENMIQANAGTVNSGAIRSRLKMTCIPVASRKEMILQVTMPKRLIGVRALQEPEAQP